MIQIRLASIEDTQRLIKCETIIWESLRETLPDAFVNSELSWLHRPELAERRRNQLQSTDTLVLVAEEDSGLIGVAMGRVGEEGVSMLNFLGVKPKNRGKGVAAQLLDRFIEEAGKRKAHKVWLYTAPSLQPAIRLYIKAGFVPEGYLKNHSYGQDLIIYSKFLQKDKHL
jgi:ribosomal protein S18 acetylase RimI-like enzyme